MLLVFLQLESGGDGGCGRSGRFTVNDLMTMSKPEMIKHIEDLYRNMAVNVFF